MTVVLLGLVSLSAVIYLLTRGGCAATAIPPGTIHCSKLVFTGNVIVFQIRGNQVDHNYRYQVVLVRTRDSNELTAKVPVNWLESDFVNVAVAVHRPARTTPAEPALVWFTLDIDSARGGRAADLSTLEFPIMSDHGGVDYLWENDGIRVWVNDEIELWRVLAPGGGVRCLLRRSEAQD